MYREGRKRSAWGWNAKCPHSRETRTFVLKPLPNKDITVSTKRTLEPQNLLNPLQSAYRPNHSTETALLRIVNDLLTAMDNNKICILTLFWHCLLYTSPEPTRQS